VAPDGIGIVGGRDGRLGFIPLGGLPLAMDKDSYSEKEAQARFEAALKGALNTPHKPLKEMPKAKKVKKYEIN
jgi:hypothetical protein